MATKNNSDDDLHLESVTFQTVGFDETRGYPLSIFDMVSVFTQHIQFSGFIPLVHFFSRFSFKSFIIVDLLNKYTVLVGEYIFFRCCSYPESKIIVVVKPFSSICNTHFSAFCQRRWLPCCKSIACSMTLQATGIFSDESLGLSEHLSDTELQWLPSGPLGIKHGNWNPRTKWRFIYSWENHLYMGHFPLPRLPSVITGR